MRLVVAGHDYALIENSWTLQMVMDANDSIDIQEAANAKAHARAREEAEQRG